MARDATGWRADKKGAMRHRRDGPVVVLSPHLDDAVLSAWSVLRRPGPVVVVNVCDGVPPPGALGPHDRVKGATDSAAFMALRREEDRAALALAGREPVGLGFLDAQYRHAGAALDPLAALRAAVPEAALLCAPAGLGGHADHVACREAALAAGVPVSLYADLPYAARVGWPAWVTGSDPRPHLVPEARWDEFLATASCGPEALTARVVRLEPEEVERRERALRTYATQFEVLDGGPIGRITHPAVRGYEVHWDVLTTP
jgi:LmbE family N-acetylglucosaminyl deacetylase